MSAASTSTPADEFRRQLAERRKLHDRSARVMELACTAGPRLDRVVGGGLDVSMLTREPVVPSGTGFPDLGAFVAEADRLLAAHAEVEKKRAAAQKQLDQVEQTLGAEKSRRRQKAAARVGLLLLLVVFCGAIAARVMTAG